MVTPLHKVGDWISWDSISYGNAPVRVHYGRIAQILPDGSYRIRDGNKFARMNACNVRSAEQFS